jgi:transposase
VLPRARRSVFRARCPPAGTPGQPAVIARRRGKAKAQVAVARSILVIIWHLIADPAARYTDLGYGYHQARTDIDRKLRNHIRQIQALGFAVTLTRAA